MMNDDLQSYIEPELEARIVALVLGEASAFEAEELEKLIAERAELQAYRERLAKVHGVVGEAHREVNEEEWKLSTEKREAILSRYRETAQAEVIEKKNQSAQRKTRRARRKLILACAACLLMTLTLGRFLMQGDGQKDAVALTSIKEEGVSREAMLAQMDADIIAQNDIVQNHRKDLTVLVQQYGIPYFDGSQSNPLGDSEQTMFRAARGKLADFETQKEEIEGQLKELVSKDNSDLVEYAAGLDLPENQVDHHFDQYRDSVNQRSGLLAQGLSEEHPDVLAASERAQTSMAGARKEATALKSVLETKLGLVNRQVESMKEMVDNRKSDTVDLSLRQHTYTQAKESYEQSREMLREMKMAKIRTGFGFAESESPGLSTDRASVREALSSLDAASPGIVTNFPVTPATPVMKVDKFSNGMGAGLDLGHSFGEDTQSDHSEGYALESDFEGSGSLALSWNAGVNLESSEPDSELLLNGRVPKSVNPSSSSKPRELLFNKKQGVVIDSSVVAKLKEKEGNVSQSQKKLKVPLKSSAPNTSRGRVIAAAASTETKVPVPEVIKEGWKRSRLPKQVKVLTKHVDVYQRNIEELNFDFDSFDDDLDSAGKKVTAAKLNQIILPELNLENTTVEEALAFIQKRTNELDSTTIDPMDAGINFSVRQPDVSAGELPNDGFRAEFDSRSNVIKKLNLKDVPAGVALQYIADAAKLRYKIEDDGSVTMLPVGGDVDVDLEQRRWRIPPDFDAFITTSGGGDDDPFATESGQESGGIQAREDITTILRENGISFPPNARASLIVEDDVLIVRNTPTNLDLIDGIVKAAGASLEKKKEEEEQREIDALALQKERENFEFSTSQKSDSTFSLNVSDVSFKLAKSSLAEGAWPEAAQIRAEEFVNALDYDDAKPTQSEKVANVIEQGAHPFIPQRNLMRVAMSTASLGRNASTPLRLTILLDQSGSMERVDRAESVKRAFALLAAQLTKDDEVTLIGFARTPRLLAERMTGDEAAKLADIVANPLTEGGTNLEAALTLGQQMARQQFLPAAQNRLILLTDGAANLGDALPKNLSEQVASMRALGIAFDACGVGADGLNDEVLSALAKQGDGRYYFLDRPEDADAGFAKQIAGALRPAAKNVKVQILFNPERVSKFKLYGFEKHQLKKQDFRNDAIDAAEMAAEESGVALYHFEPIPEGRGDVGTVSVRFLDTASSEMVERTWAIPYQAEVALFSEAKASLRLAATAGLFAEKLKASPVGERVELKKLRQEMELLKPIYKTQARFDELKNMLQQAGE